MKKKELNLKTVYTLSKSQGHLLYEFVLFSDDAYVCADCCLVENYNQFLTYVTAVAFQFHGTTAKDYSTIFNQDIMFNPVRFW